VRKRLHSQADSRVRLSDVATTAGVSTATVSRTLNAPEKVAPAARERVVAAIAELGYVPHGAARALASQRSMTIGVLIPTLENSIFAASVHGLEQRLERDGYNLLLASSEYDPDREVAQAKVLIERGVDGLVLVGTAHHPALYERLQQASIPYVTTWSFDSGGDAPSIGIDNRGAMAGMVRYLLDLGHTAIAIISPSVDSNDRIAARRGGVRDAMAERGLAFDERYLAECRYSIMGGRESLRFLMNLDPAPTAIVCTSDVLAFGAMVEARAQGIAIPAALSITGFDDLDFAEHLQPPLTTIHVPAADLGARAADYLLASIAGRPIADRIELPVNLIVRGTTSRPRPTGS